MKDGAHTHGASPAGAIGALAAVAAVAAIAQAILSVIWAILAAVVVAAAGLVYTGWRMHQKYGRAPQVLPWEQRAALPPPEARPVTARPVQALPAPQIVNFNFYGVSAAEAARVAEQQRRAIDEGR